MPKTPKLKYAKENLEKAIAEIQNNKEQLSNSSEIWRAAVDSPVPQT